MSGRVPPYHPKSGEKDPEGAESRLAMCLLEFGGTQETGRHNILMKDKGKRLRQDLLMRTA